MIWLLLILLTQADGQAGKFYYSSNDRKYPCADNNDIEAFFKAPFEPQYQYSLYVTREIKPDSRIVLRFDSEVTLNLVAPSNARISESSGNLKILGILGSVRPKRFIVTFTEKTSLLHVQVIGAASGLNIPHVLNVILDGEELCEEPKIRYFYDDLSEALKNSDSSRSLPGGRVEKTSLIDESCGKRKVVHTELIVRGQPTQPGDWPWHAAIFRGITYICGGTLLSKTLVLTAAHCATKESNPVVPESLTVALGKYHRIAEEMTTQEREVFEVIVHPEFNRPTLLNDIAFLKLKTEAVFDDYVQPACFWHTGLPTEEVFGTVVGWGLNHEDQLSSTLQQVTIPIIPELTCLKSNPIIFHRKLNTNKICAGFANGTSACNGDSGGGLMVFVPDKAGDTGKVSGAWYVRGIVSLSVRRADIAICEPYEYTYFTDLEKYLDWVMQYLK